MRAGATNTYFFLSLSFLPPLARGRSPSFAPSLARGVKEGRKPKKPSGSSRKLRKLGEPGGIGNSNRWGFLVAKGTGAMQRRTR